MREYSQYPEPAYGHSWRQLEGLISFLVASVMGMWRYRWTMVLAAWSVFLVGAFLVYRLPDRYEADARVYVDTDSILHEVVRDLTVAPNAMTEINMLTRALVSRPQLERVAQTIGLDRPARSAREFEQVLVGLRERITVRGDGDHIYVISYQDTSAQRAEGAVTALLQSFVEDYLGRQRTESSAATRFLEEQIREYEQRLEEAERRLADFKRLNVGLMPGEAGDYYARLDTSMAAVAATRAELDSAIQRRNEFAKQLEGEQPVFGFGPALQPSFSGSSRDATIARYQSQIDDLLLQYTPKHPSVVALQEMVERLERERLEELQRRPTVALPVAPQVAISPLDVNPVYQRMRIGLSEAEVEIATLRQRLAMQEQAVSQLTALVDTIPDIERQLFALNRDYRVTTEQYEVLLHRRESMYMTGAVEQSGNNIDFRVIEPAAVPLTPFAPNRPLLLSGALLAGLVTALALAVLLDRLNPVVYSRRELIDLTDLPVLGAISKCVTPSERRQSRWHVAQFSAACVTLLAAFVLAVLFSESVTDLAHRLMRGEVA